LIARLASTGLLAIASLFVSQATATASQDPYGEIAPLDIANHVPSAVRYYGTVSPYPLGYYPYPVNFEYPAVPASYGLGYYPYAVPTYTYAAGYYPGVAVYYPYPRWGGYYPYGFAFWPYGF
jgi:hypothetical protein